MADSDLLNHYKIDTLVPSAWPVEKDLEDSSDEELSAPTSKHGRKVSRSRYSVLESPRRTSVPGAERSKDGVENLVQKDEPDPLGSSGSVIQSLRRQGMQIDDDSKSRRHRQYPRRKTRLTTSREPVSAFFDDILTGPVLSGGTSRGSFK